MTVMALREILQSREGLVYLVAFGAAVYLGLPWWFFVLAGPVLLLAGVREGIRLAREIRSEWRDF